MLTHSSVLSFEQLSSESCSLSLLESSCKSNSFRARYSSSRFSCESFSSASRLSRAAFSSAARLSDSCLFSSRIARATSLCLRLDAFDLAEAGRRIAPVMHAVQDHGTFSISCVTCTQVKWCQRSHLSHCTISMLSASVHIAQLDVVPGLNFKPALVRLLFMFKLRRKYMC